MYNAGAFDILRRLEEQGYLFVRNVIDAETANRARCAMLKQAAQDGAIHCTDDISFELGRIAKHGRTYARSYCFDGVSGSEVNNRSGIDVDAWMDLCPSDVMVKQQPRTSKTQRYTI